MKSRYDNPFSSFDTTAKIINNIGLAKNRFTAVAQALNNLTKPYIINLIGVANNIFEYINNEKKAHNLFKKSIINMWKDLEKELQSNNRYFPKTDLLTVLDKFTKITKYNLSIGKTLYRARIIQGEEFPDNIQEIIDYILENINHSKSEDDLISSDEIITLIDEMSYDDWDIHYADKEYIKKILFWGYEEKDSDAPRNNTKHGRANPIGISYLYTSDNLKTSIAEIQPTIDQFVSVAQIKIRKKLKLFNFIYPQNVMESKTFKQSISEVTEQLKLDFFEQIEIFFNTMSDLYTKPIKGDTDYYYTTQFISEFLKNKGFDGIKYKSSLSKIGSNIILFDTSKNTENKPINYEILGSTLHRVKNVTITSKQFLPKIPDKRKINNASP